MSKAAAIKFTTKEKHWILYDVANSAYVLLCTAVTPIYFASISTGNNIVQWGYAETIASLVAALLMPFLGSLADFRGNKLKFFLGFFLTGVVACAALALSTWWLLFLGIYIVSAIAFHASVVFYDGMLVDITEDSRMDQVSSHGFAWGYVGSTIPFILCLILIFAGPKVGISTSMATRLSFVITAVWWLVFTIPLVRTYEHLHFKDRVHGEVHNVFKEMKHTMSKIWRDKTLRLFMIAYFFYIDGVHTIIKMSTSYGTSLGISSTQLVLALLVTQFVGFPSAILYGRFAKRFGTKRMIIIAIIAYTSISVFAAFFLRTAVEFWILAIMVGLFQGGIQALSRSYLGKIVPKKNANEFYGFFDIFGRYAAVLGTFIMSFVTQITGVAELGILSISALFVVGLIAFIAMPHREHSNHEAHA